MLKPTVLLLLPSWVCEWTYLYNYVKVHRISKYYDNNIFKVAWVEGTYPLHTQEPSAARHTYLWQTFIYLNWAFLINNVFYKIPENNDWENNINS